MPRRKTISDEEVLTIARSLFLQEGATASTRTLAKLAGISEAVIFQRFGTKADLFFAAMVLPAAQLEAMFNVQPGEKQVVENLESIGLQIVAYFREMMPVFLALISHPAFDMPTFLQRHTAPMEQIEQGLTTYLQAEANLGRVDPNNIAVAAAVLFSHLHSLVLSETIGAQPSADTDGAVAAAIALLWQGLAPK